MKKIFLYMIFAILLMFEATFSQRMMIVGLDTTNYPIINAKFFVFDNKGNIINNFNKSDLKIFENGQLIDKVDVYCPPQTPPIPISAVLTADISGSMAGERIRFFKEGIIHFINNLPLGMSEAAISSFDDFNYLNQDFTTNKSKLLNAVNSLNSKAGTDYNAALIKPYYGALQISKQAKNDKVIILLTDGKSNTETLVDSIIEEANLQNCKVFSIVSAIKCPESLKIIANNTGALWFEDINTEDEAKAVYNAILMISQKIEPCEVEWKADHCNSNLVMIEFNLESLKLKSKKTYHPPKNKIPNIEIKPEIIKFTNGKIAVSEQQFITLKAINSDFEIKYIELSNSNFDINPKSISLKSGESKQLIVSYTPKDSSTAFCKVNLINDVCDKSFSMSASFTNYKIPKKYIKLIAPNGNEVFIAGTKTEILYEGIDADSPVDIDYSIDNGFSWINIATNVSGLKYEWIVPPTPSNICLARVSAGAIDTAIDLEMVMIPKGKFVMGNTGNYIGYPEEKPVHSVEISSDFLMSKYEITQKIYKTIMGINPSNFKGDSLPVEMISWEDAIEFCNKLSDYFNFEKCYLIEVDPKSQNKSISCNWTANGFRLPTEAEWEYAAKANTNSDYYNGDLLESDCTPLDSNLNLIAWYCGNAKSNTANVGLKQANSFGLFDMSGNVWEWCWDYFGIYSTDFTIDPTGPINGTSRVLKGGSWVSNPYFCRPSLRYSFPEGRSNSFGIRVVRKGN